MLVGACLPNESNGDSITLIVESAKPSVVFRKSAYKNAKFAQNTVPRYESLGHYYRKRKRKYEYAKKKNEHRLMVVRLLQLLGSAKNMKVLDITKGVTGSLAEGSKRIIGSAK